MIRISPLASICAVLLALSPGVSRAARPVATVSGIIIQAPASEAPKLLTIESGSDAVVLKVTRKTDVAITPPPVPGEEPDPEAVLEVGRRVDASYDPASRVALVLRVADEPEVIHRTGTLTAVGPLNTITFDPDGDNPPEELVLQAQSRLYVGSAPVSPEQLPLLVGVRVDVLQFVDSLGVERVRFEPANIETAIGVVRSSGETPGTLRVAFRNETVELTLPVGISVQAIGDTVPPAALQTGDRVRVTAASLPSDVNLALEIELIGVPVRSASGRLTEVDPGTGSIRVRGSGPSTFRVLDEAPITFHEVGEAPVAVTLAQLAEALPQFTRLVVRVKYLARGKNRIVTRLEVTGERPTPPDPTSF